MELGIKGKRAFVTGGASGIGKAVVKDLAKAGVKVAFTSRDEKVLNETLKEVGGDRAGHLGIVGNIADDGAPAKFTSEVISRLGNIDIVVNNVGGTLGILDPLCPISDWRRLFRLDLEVHIEVNNLFIPYMKEQKWGRIVNISAGSAMENNGPVPYCTMKAAYAAYTRCMGRVLASDHIVMSAVLPGVVLTEHGDWQRNIKERPEYVERYLEERTSLKRFGKPEEISPIVVFLCSELASFCQGSIIPVEGAQLKGYLAGSYHVIA